MHDMRICRNSNRPISLAWCNLLHDLTLKSLARTRARVAMNVRYWHKADIAYHDAHSLTPVALRVGAMALFHSGIAGANVMEFKKYFASGVATVTNVATASFVAGLVSIWLAGYSPAVANTIELQFSDNLSGNLGDNIDIVITTATVPGPYPSSGSLITNITGQGFLSYNFGLGTIQYPVNLSGPNSNSDADNLLFSTFPFIDANGIGLHTDSLLGIYTDFTLRAVPVGNGFRYDLCTSDCVSNNIITLSFTLTPVADPTQTPLPAALPLFATGLGALGLLGWRRKRKQAV
jgi:hypothetical protein